MANTEWASAFFNKVTSKLPDLLTKHGEGKELEAFEELRIELIADGDESKKARAKQLQGELDALNGKTPPVDPPQPAADAAAEAAKAASEGGAKASGRR